MGILNQDFLFQNCILVLFLPFYVNVYNDIQTELPFSNCTSNHNRTITMVTFLPACLSSEDHLEGLSSVSPAVSGIIP